MEYVHEYIVFMIIHMREFVHRLSYNIRRTYRTCHTVCGVNVRHTVCGVKCTSYSMWRIMYVIQYVAYNVRHIYHVPCMAWFEINSGYLFYIMDFNWPVYIQCIWWSGSVVSGQWSVVIGQWSVVSGQRSEVSSQWLVVSGQWLVVSGQ